MNALSQQSGQVEAAELSARLATISLSLARLSSEFASETLNAAISVYQPSDEEEDPFVLTKEAVIRIKGVYKRALATLEIVYKQLQEAPIEPRRVEPLHDMNSSLLRDDSSGDNSGGGCCCGIQ